MRMQSFQSCVDFYIEIDTSIVNKELFNSANDRLRVSYRLTGYEPGFCVTQGTA